MMLSIIQKSICWLAFATVTFSVGVNFAQTCTPGKSYPYTFCVGGTHSEILCSRCPTNSVRGIPLKPGMPACVTLTIGTDSTSLSSWATNTPCDRLRQVENVFNLGENGDSAIANWTGICSSVPADTCCWDIYATDNAAQDIYPLTKNDSTPAASSVSFTITSSSCTADCRTYRTYMNFSNNFLVPHQFKEGITAPAPCNIIIPENTWVDPEDEGNISVTNSFIFYVNTVDILTHELGHILGVPEEKKFPSGCKLNGIMTGDTDIVGGVLQHKGLPVNDEARCWFKQLYCPDPCRDAVSDLSLPPSFDLGQPFPNPLSGNVLDVPYSIGSAGNMSLALFDVLGKPVGTAFESKAIPGKYDYQLNCGGLASGSYYVRLSLNGYPLTKRIEVNHDR